MRSRASGDGLMTSLATLVDRAVSAYADRTAVLDGMRSFSFAQVGSRADRLARVLQDLSPEPGSRVAVLLPNRIELVEIDFGVAKSGKVRAPMNPRLKPAERVHIMSNCGADVLITHVGEREFAESIRDQLPALHHIVFLDGEPSDAHSDYEQALAAADGSAQEVRRDPSEPSLLMHTSGTTGLPKGAVLSERARVAAATHMMLHEVDIQPEDGMIHAAPISHGSGSKVLPFFLRGARNIPLGQFSAAEFVRAVMKLGGTCSFMVPTMLQMLLDSPELDALDVAQLRNVTYGGAPAAPALVAAALRRLGPVLTQVYGACEALHPVAVLTRRDHVEIFGPDASTVPDVLPVGRVTMFSSVDIEGGSEGEIVLAGPTVFSGYWGDAVATDEVLADGWYRTGDVGFIDDCGYLQIRGRSKDMVISGGLNVYPAEIEAVLRLHEAVTEAAVIGLPDELWGETVVAVIVAAADVSVTAAQIVEFCRPRLANYKQPRLILFAPSLPQGPTSKIQKDQVRLWAAAQLLAGQPAGSGASFSSAGGLPASQRGDSA
jgi:acyl-CoA synthetase (AMP-forming)/AMP-acid ligase II